MCVLTGSANTPLLDLSLISFMEEGSSKTKVCIMKSRIFKLLKKTRKLCLICTLSLTEMVFRGKNLLSLVYFVS